MRLDGQVMVVTGGASGIGKATVERALALGASVASLDVNDGPRGALALRCDVSNWDDVARAMHDVRAQLGPATILVNNAAVIRVGAFASSTLEDWERTLRVNLTGAFICTRLVLSQLAEGGASSIVNVSSIGGRLRSFNGDAAYASSKAGLIALTRQLATELAPRIRVNCVCPGGVETPMYERIVKERGGAFPHTIPLGRLASPDEIAAVICFLAAPAASYMTGQIVDVNGGLL
jgi:3-oxoacyl-[acyl-carrier protein] reductase